MVDFTTAATVKAKKYMAERGEHPRTLEVMMNWERLKRNALRTLRDDAEAKRPMPALPLQDATSRKDVVANVKALQAAKPRFDLNLRSLSTLEGRLAARVMAPVGKLGMLADVSQINGRLVIKIGSR